MYGMEKPPSDDTYQPANQKCGSDHFLSRRASLTTGYGVPQISEKCQQLGQDKEKTRIAHYTTKTSAAAWQGFIAALSHFDSKLNPHEFIGGFERLAIACLHGDGDKRDSPGRRERIPWTGA
jgi:hypothetical protein